MLQPPNKDCISIGSSDVLSVKFNTKFLENNVFNSYNSSLEDNLSLIDIFEKYNPEIVVNLAAQAGVRYSKIDPKKYTTTNIFGTLNLLNSLKLKKIDGMTFNPILNKWSVTSDKSVNYISEFKKV